MTQVPEDKGRHPVNLLAMNSCVSGTGARGLVAESRRVLELLPLLVDYIFSSGLHR
jgi:hypothetical protein